MNFLAKKDKPKPTGRRWYEGLYFRFSAACFLVLSLVAVVNVFITMKAWITVAEDVEQRINWNLAEEIAIRLQPKLANSFDEDWAVKELFNYNQLYPSARFYLLDAQGRVFLSVEMNGELGAEQIPLGQIILATQPELPELPLHSFDPIEGDETVFSVSKTTCDQKPCYLYVTLTSGLFDMLQDRQGEYQVIQYAIIIAAAVFGLLIFSTLVLFLFLSGGFRQMLSVVRSIESGDYSRKIPIKGNDEIAEISRAINSMSKAVEESIDKLAATDLQRRELIANISHDLRGPLTVIEGFIETIIRKGESLTKEERESHIQRIYKNVLQQKQLTTDLFELSKLEAKEKVPTYEPFSILELVYDSAQKYRKQATEAGIQIEVNTQVDPGPVYADISMIDRVLSNLMSNAIRYCPESSELRLIVEDLGDSVRVEVADTGDGIAAEDLARIFESFYRVDKDRNRVRGGTGLGLAIVRKMIEAHGSEIFVESEVGEGTRFFFNLSKAD